MVAQTFKRDRTERITPKAAEERMGALFRNGIRSDALETLTPEGRQAVVQVMEDLVDQFPEVARNTAAVIKTPPGIKKSTIAAHYYPVNIETPLSTIGGFSDHNGAFFFQSIFTNRANNIDHNFLPRLRRYQVGDDPDLPSSWATAEVPFMSAGGADDVYRHIVSHEFGHAVHTVAEDILSITIDGKLDIGERIRSRELLRRKIEEALDEANLPRREIDLAQNVSQYATVNEAELFAESFAEVYNLGPEARPYARTIVNAVLKVIDDYDGPLP